MMYVVAYDIPCTKRRQKVANLLMGYGERVQFSVFECPLTPAKYQELKQRLRQRLCLEEDRIRIYPLPAPSLPHIEIWGGPPLTEPERSKIF